MGLKTIAIRTADVLAACPAEGEFAVLFVARAMGISSTRLSGHIDWLVKAGKLERVCRGKYRLTDMGRAMRPCPVCGKVGAADIHTCTPVERAA